jgi:tripartite-type tricarboxylate transporter receptor subunit TctC
MATPSLKQQLVALGIEPTFSTPDEFSALIRAELPKWADIVKRSGATVD